MATKANFTAEEWARLLSSPMVAGMAITAADPSGVWGLIKEGMAGGWALLEARQNAQANPLVRAVAEDFATPEGRTAARTALQSRFKGDAPLSALKDTALAELRTISGVLDAKLRKTLSLSRLGFNRWPKRPRKRGLKAASSVSAVLP